MEGGKERHEDRSQQKERAAAKARQAADILALGFLAAVRRRLFRCPGELCSWLLLGRWRIGSRLSLLGWLWRVSAWLSLLGWLWRVSAWWLVHVLDS